MDYTFTNSTLGLMCVSFTNGINTGVIEDDQNFTISLQNALMTSEVQFPSGDSASVQVLERESMPLSFLQLKQSFIVDVYHFNAAFTLTTSDSVLTAVEGQTVQVCFNTPVTITRTPLEIGLEVDPSATNATNNGSYYLKILSVAR